MLMFTCLPGAVGKEMDSNVWCSQEDSFSLWNILITSAPAFGNLGSIDGLNVLLISRDEARDRQCPRR